ncbi:hypothetical protein PUR34_18860 [Streptomyces sp. JV185]|uniref:hypothetical protein n=1 Tax=Streptomyces sp. JV185 TaxID=858638 RepID=UPI002E75D21A|nr:hypothetical protein [Streptomyces sp. JV185]MEE1770149.1 hypothetical protein [Streptomyces sp. JV185]
MRTPLLSAVFVAAMSVGLAASSAHAASGTTASDVGGFVTDGDHVHVSSTPPATASAHGWWMDPLGKHKNVKAKVTVWLQTKHGNTWRTVAEGSKKVKAGGKGASSRRANARKTCENRDRTQWRSVIDVDLIGIADSPEKAVTRTVTLACGA